MVRRILDHDSAQMTSHYARLHDTTVRRRWEAARKININGETVVLDPDGAVADAAWAKQTVLAGQPPSPTSTTSGPKLPDGLL